MHLVDFFYELYYDARFHENQQYVYVQAKRLRSFIVLTNTPCRQNVLLFNP